MSKYVGNSPLVDTIIPDNSVTKTQLKQEIKDVLLPDIQAGDAGKNVRVNIAETDHEYAYATTNLGFLNKSAWADNTQETISLSPVADAVGKALVKVYEEVPATGLTNNDWDILTDDTNFNMRDHAYAEEVTPDATTGVMTLTLTSGTWATEDINRRFENTTGIGIGTITAIDGADATVTLTEDLPDTDALASGDWSLFEGEFTTEGEFTVNKGAEYNIDNALLFDRAGLHFLTRTPGSASNRKTWTYSTWVKRSEFLGTSLSLIGAGTDFSGSGDAIQISFKSDNSLGIQAGNTAPLNVSSIAVFRDLSAWYHVVVAVDTTQAISTDRINIYMNGVEITDFSATTYPTLNYEFAINNTTEHILGDDTNISNNRLFDGYMADTYLIDGLALTPSDFGDTSPQGNWIPKAYSGTYGTNGFFLEYQNSAGLGDDTSGNGNDFTTNNIVATDQVIDTPTDNFCTLNPLDNAMGATLSEGNLKVVGVANDKNIHSTFVIPKSGKWYWEVEIVNQGVRNQLGMNDAEYNSLFEGTNYFYVQTHNGGVVTSATKNSNIGSAFVNGDILCIAVDMDNGQVWATKNTNINTGGTANVTDLPTTIDYKANYRETATVSTNEFNFGQKDFTYTPPLGFLALSSDNLPDPVIKKPSEYMEPVLYTGNGSTQSITGMDFQPDFVWIKRRNVASSHKLFDSIRTLGFALESDTTGTDNDHTSNFTSFDVDGFSLAGTNGAINGSADDYVAWCWKEGALPGFDIVSYTGNGVAGRTEAHSLGVAPEMMIVKGRNIVDSWYVYHSSLGGTKNLNLDLTAAVSTSITRWNDTEPDTINFTLGTSLGVNGNGDDYIAYLFASVEGFSKFGSYTGNGSTDGPFIHCGFKPAFIMIKRSDGAEPWMMYDGKRSPFNVVDTAVFANSTSADSSNSGNNHDFLSNGFKLRSTHSAMNGSGAEYIYMAFAEMPFKDAVGSFNITNKHIAAVSNNNGQIDTKYYADYNSFVTTETLNGQTLNYAWSRDARRTFEIVGSGESTVRNIASDDTTVHSGTDGVWYINTNAAYGLETWVAAGTDNMYAALEEAMDTTKNNMDGTAFTAISDANLPDTTLTLDMAVIAYTTDQSDRPLADKVVFNYDANILNEDKTEDYLIDMPAVDEVRVTSPAAGGPRSARIIIIRG